METVWSLGLNADYYVIRLTAEVECGRNRKFWVAKVEVLVCLVMMRQQAQCDTWKA